MTRQIFITSYALLRCFVCMLLFIHFGANLSKSSVNDDVY